MEKDLVKVYERDLKKKTTKKKDWINSRKTGKINGKKLKILKVIDSKKPRDLLIEIENQIFVKLMTFNRSVVEEKGKLWAIISVNQSKFRRK